MKKNFMLALLVLLCILCLPSCNSLSNTEISKESELPDSDVDSNEKPKEFSFNTEIEFPEQSEIMTYSASAMVVEPELIAASLLPNTDIVFSEQDDGSLSYQSNDDWLYINTNTMGFTFSNEEVKIYNQYFNTSAPMYEDLAFISYEDAYTEISEIIRGLNIGDFEIDKVYTMDREYLKNLEESCLQEENFLDDVAQGRAKVKGDWSEEEGCYVFYINCYVNKVPVYSETYENSNQDIISGTYIEVFYSNRGVISFIAEGLYDIEYDSGHKAALISTEEIKEKISDKYNSVIITSPISIEKASIIYLPVMNYEQNKYDLIPVWDISVSQVGHASDKEAFISEIEAAGLNIEDYASEIDSLSDETEDIQYNIYFRAEDGMELLI